MDEFEKKITEQYNIRIIQRGYHIDKAYYYTFMLSPLQQGVINRYEKHEIEEFVIKAKMCIVDMMRIPLGQLKGECEYLQGMLKISGSHEFIELMLFQLFSDNKNKELNIHIDLN